MGIENKRLNAATVENGTRVTNEKGIKIISYTELGLGRAQVHIYRRKITLSTTSRREKCDVSISMPSSVGGRGFVVAHASHGKGGNESVVKWRGKMGEGGWTALRLCYILLPAGEPLERVLWEVPVQQCTDPVINVYTGCVLTFWTKLILR